MIETNAIVLISYNNEQDPPLLIQPALQHPSTDGHLSSAFFFQTQKMNKSPLLEAEQYL